MPGSCSVCAGKSQWTNRSLRCVMTASQHQYTTKKRIATLTSTSIRRMPSSVKRLYQQANFYDCVKSAAWTTISKNQRPQWSLSSSRVVILSNLCGRVDVRQLLHQELTYWLERTQTRPRLTECQWSQHIIQRTRLQ